MSASDSVTGLMNRLRAGDDVAAREVFVRFAARLVELAYRHLGARMAVKVDPEDIIQSAYMSFFVCHRDGRLEVGSWDGLWGVLTVITLRKCTDRPRYFRAGKRALTREAAGGGADDGNPPVTDLALDREPLPDEAAVLAETVEALFRTVDDADERAILELSLQGYTATEIGEKLGRAKRTVRRLRERVRKLGGSTLKSIGHIKRLQRVLDNDADYVEPEDMLAELCEDNKTLAARLREAHIVCEEFRDIATTSLIEVWIDETEQRTWFLFESSPRGMTGGH